MQLFELGLEIKTEGMSKASATLKEIDVQGAAVARRFSGIAGALGGIVTAASVVAVGKFLGDAISEASDAEQKLNELKQAVNNVGGNFEKLSPALEEAANKMQKFTRFSDDATRGALTRMILISQDTAGSLKNIGLAADIAAAKHMDLGDAAEIVGKVMTGNVRGLKEFGISTKDSGEALDQLRTKFRGFADEDGKSFQGRLEQIKNAWADVLEAIGKAIIGGDDAADSLGILTTRLGELSHFIDENGAKWRGWGEGVLKVAEGAAAALNRVSEEIERAGLLLHGMITGDFRKLGEFNDFRDVSSGTSSGKGQFADVTSGGDGNNRAPRRLAGGGKAGRGGRSSGVGIPSGDFTRFDSVSQARMDAIGQHVAINVGGIDLNGTPVPGVGMSADDLDKLFANYHDHLASGAKQISDTITQGMAQTLGDAVYNAFSAAFNGEGLGGIFKAFGKTVLAGVGQIFTQLGMTYLEYGLIMQKLAAFLPNPFTAGAAGVAIGAALIAMGAALGAVGHGGGRGTAGAGAFREPRVAASEVTRIRFVDSATGRPLDPMQPKQYNFTVIGANDPKAQREIKQLIENGDRRSA